VIYGLRREVRRARQLGQYTLEGKIGEGGMGAVYRARHALLRRPTAIKLIRASDASESLRARFEREVQLTSSLTHPNTIAIYDYGHTPDGVFYYAMEFLLPGLSLQTLVDGDGPQPEARVIQILRQVCGALGEAHGIGLIHRDIKPANIMLCERGGVYDVVKVLDFGLVKEVGESSDQTLTGVNTITGTPLYMTPEAIESPELVDARSDLYAVGAVAYFLLTGKPVFEGRSTVEVLAHHLHDSPVAPSERLGRAIEPALERLILSCLSKDRADRPADAAALLAALDAGPAAHVPPWTPQDARAWWETRAGECLECESATKLGKPEPECCSVEVDLSGRLAAGSATGGPEPTE
jgi:serine/threonine-protein kinase